jgi:hypothetical protein
MFIVVQLASSHLGGIAASGHLKARLIGLARLLRPLFDERKAGAGAARRAAEDGAAPASAPRLGSRCVR